MTKITALPLLAALLLAAPALAAPEAYDCDSEHTQVFFSVSHLGFSYSMGRFNDVACSFVFDPENAEASSASARIAAGSIDMGGAKWDAHMKSADFLDAEKHPLMTFKSTRIEKTGEKTGKMTGDLTLRGVTKPVTLDVTWNGAGTHPYSLQHVAGFSAAGVLKRADFGITYGLPGVGDDVTLNIQVEGARRTAPAGRTTGE